MWLRSRSDSRADPPGRRRGPGGDASGYQTVPWCLSAVRAIVGRTRLTAQVDTVRASVGAARTYLYTRDRLLRSPRYRAKADCPASAATGSVQPRHRAPSGHADHGAWRYRGAGQRGRDRMAGSAADRADPGSPGRGRAQLDRGPRHHGGVEVHHLRGSHPERPQAGRPHLGSGGGTRSRRIRGGPHPCRVDTGLHEDDCSAGALERELSVCICPCYSRFRTADRRLHSARSHPGVEGRIARPFRS